MILNKRDLDKLRFVSVRGEMYVHRADLEAALAEAEKTERDEAKPEAPKVTKDASK